MRKGKETREHQTNDRRRQTSIRTTEFNGDGMPSWGRGNEGKTKRVTDSI